MKDLCRDLGCVIELSKENKLKNKHADQLQRKYFLQAEIFCICNGRN